MKLTVLILSLTLSIKSARGQDADSAIFNGHFLIFMESFNDSARLEFYIDSADTKYKWADSFYLETNESTGSCINKWYYFRPEYKNAYVIIALKAKNFSLRIPLKETDTMKCLYIYKRRDLLYASRESKLLRLE